MNARSAEVLIEIKAILQANPMVTTVTIGKAEALAAETSDVAVYIQHPNLVSTSSRNTIGADGYDYKGYYLLTVNVDCTADDYKIYDLADSLQRSLLTDSAIWSKLVDRDIITVEYDNYEFSPKRSMVIALEVTFRMQA
jgi:hypothetical protein